MVTTKVSVYLLAVLISLSFINCQDGLPSFPGMSSLPGLPSLPGIPSFPGFSGLPSIRKKRQLPNLDASDDERIHQDRLFFNFFGTPATCNFTTEPDSTCRSCTQVMTCRPNNTGFLRRCHGWFHPYCNSGSCSKFPGSACDTTTSTTTSTTTTTTTTMAPGK